MLVNSRRSAMACRYSGNAVRMDRPPSDNACSLNLEWQWHQLGRMQACTSLQTDNHASTPPLRVIYRPDAVDDIHVFEWSAAHYRISRTTVSHSPVLRHALRHPSPTSVPRFWLNVYDRMSTPYITGLGISHPKY